MTNLPFTLESQVRCQSESESVQGFAKKGEVTLETTKLNVKDIPTSKKFTSKLTLRQVRIYTMFDIYE